jgi:hypothetical protein
MLCNHIVGGMHGESATSIGQVWAVSSHLVSQAMEAGDYCIAAAVETFCQDTPTLGGVGGGVPRHEAYCMAIIGHVGSEGATTKSNTIFSTISSYLS